MKFEQYKPKPEEVQKAEEIMTEEQKIASQEREKNWPKEMWGISFSGKGKDKKTNTTYRVFRSSKKY